MAAAAAEFQHLAYRPVCLAEQPPRERGLLRVLLWRRNQRPPRRQVLVEPVTGLLRSHASIFPAPLQAFVVVGASGHKRIWSLA